MKLLLKKVSLISVSLVVASVVVGCGNQQGMPGNTTYAPTQGEINTFEQHAKEEHGEGHVYVTAEQLAKYPSSELSDLEIADIVHMRQEEKLARDVYRTLGETYAINQFKNIPMSEQKHTDAMELLLERYDIEDPIIDETSIGTYKDEKFTTLFVELTQQGAPSLVDALTVGATVEDLNMAKLLEVIENTDNEDLRFVYESVLKQSHSHMNAFINALRKEGATYSPEYVTQEYFDSVIGA